MKQNNGASSPAQINELAEAGQIALVALDALTSRVCVIDAEGLIIAANKAWRDFVANAAGMNATSGLNCWQSPSTIWNVPNWLQTASDDDRQTVRDMLAGKHQSFSFEYECYLNDYLRVFLTRITRLPGDGPGMLLIEHDEITERRHAEEAQHRSEKRLKQLGAHLETVREEQSAMIARELHDELGALLTMVKLELAVTATKAKTKSLRNKFNELHDRVDAALQSVKRISTNLRPAMLDLLGLMATIRWYVEQFSRSTGIATELQLPEYVRLSDASNIVVFRIIQEALTNVVTHAGASQVAILVSKRNGVLVVEIIDNGKGISEQDMFRPNSFGITGMYERVQYLGGTLSITGKPGDGTRLAMQIPMDS